MIQSARPRLKINYRRRGAPVLIIKARRQRARCRSSSFLSICVWFLAEERAVSLLNCFHSAMQWSERARALTHREPKWLQAVVINSAAFIKICCSHKNLNRVYITRRVCFCLRCLDFCSLSLLCSNSESSNQERNILCAISLLLGVEQIKF